jgi:bacteriochlorophyllide a dehydrogenase
MDATAVVIDAPGTLRLRRLPLPAQEPGQVLVQVEWSGISTGTERLLWTGRMPDFPGMGYPLVPGYESVGVVVHAGDSAKVRPGNRVFVPGANCFGEVRSLFGGAASHLLVPEARVVRIDERLEERGILLALAATARHALLAGEGRLPDLIVGHGVLGRLMARLAVALGGHPVVWETSPLRSSGAEGYEVRHPGDDSRRDYRTIVDVSGDAALVDSLLSRLGRGGELVLAGFYDRISFSFPPAFMKEIRLRVAAEWQPADLAGVTALLSSGRLSLDGLITHRASFSQAADAYATAFGDPACLKMLLDWRDCR